MNKICFFCELWESGGIESFLNSVISFIDLGDAEIDIVVGKLGHSIFTKNLKARGVKFIELSGKVRGVKNHILFAKLLKEKNYTSVHLNLFQNLALYYLRQARKAGVPVRIAHAHSVGLRKSRTRRLKLMINCISRLLWRKEMTCKLACSDAAAHFIFGGPADEIIKNGIDAVKFGYSPIDRETVRGELGIENSPIICQVGRLCWQKNQLFSLSVHKELLKKHPDAKLLFVGEGDMLDDLKKRAMELGTAESVIFHGLSHNIPALMSASDVFLFPSNMEGLGIVAIEAQASGLPTLCSDKVPQEAFVTDLALSIPLSGGAKKWAQEIDSALILSQKRRSRYAEICAAGYDIRSTACQIRRYLFTTDNT